MQWIHAIYELAFAAGIFGAGVKSLAPYAPSLWRWTAWAVAAIRRVR